MRLVLLVPAYAVVVAAPSGAEQGCPTPHQISDALMARIPAVVVPASDASTPGVLRLTVSGGSGAAPLRVDLTDQGGEARLHRDLTLAERGHGSDCMALADTVALIVDRFLHDLGYEAPPSPPPPDLTRPADNLTRGPPPAAPVTGNRLDLFVGGAWRGTSTEDSDFEAGVGLGLERGVGTRRLAATFSAGVSPSQTQATGAGGTASLRRVPLRFGLLLPMVLGPGSLEPGFRLAVDWLFTSLTTTANGTESHMKASPGAELVLGYRVGLVQRLFARLNASGGLGVPYNFVTLSDPVTPQRTVFGEPRFYVKTGLEVGFSFQ